MSSSRIDACSDPDDVRSGRRGWTSGSLPRSLGGRRSSIGT